MGPVIFSLIGGFPFLPGPLERSSTVLIFAFFLRKHNRRTDGRTDGQARLNRDAETHLKTRLILIRIFSLNKTSKRVYLKSAGCSGFEAHQIVFQTRPTGIFKLDPFKSWNLWTQLMKFFCEFFSSQCFVSLENKYSPTAEGASGTDRQMDRHWRTWVGF